MHVMVAKYEAAARQLPTARLHDGRDSVLPSRHPSESRLAAAVVGDREGDEKDPYADVPCTD